MTTFLAVIHDFLTIFHAVEITTCGAVAQLGARVNGIHEVAGSIPASSTKPSLLVGAGIEAATGGFEGGAPPSWGACEGAGPLSKSR